MKNLTWQNNTVSRNKISCQILCFALWILLCAGMFANAATTPPGSGTVADPYQISILDHLVWMGDNVASSFGKSYKLMNDIDASDTANWNDSGTDTSVLEGFKPIGTYSTPFKGFFDGASHKITRLTINRVGSIAGTYTEGMGFWGYTDTGCTIKNLSLGDAAITGNQRVGGLVGFCKNSAISNCSVTGVITGDDTCGGLIGEIYTKSTVTNCFATCAIRDRLSPTQGGGTGMGGLVGNSDDTLNQITNCYATGTVLGVKYLGGLVGANSGVIVDSYASGAVMSSVVTGGYWLGGLVGSSNGVITNCYAKGNVAGGLLCVGGLVGYSDYTCAITNCYATGNVNGVSNSIGVGGLVGNSRLGPISLSYAIGDVTGFEKVGGLVGYFYAGETTTSISNCYATGSILGNTSVGGLVGLFSSLNGGISRGKITNCYSIGAVKGTGTNPSIGGLIGILENNLTVISSYWDMDASAVSTSAGGTGKTTAEMKSQTTFVGWDFSSIWTISATKNSGYPYLTALGVYVPLPTVSSLLINNGDATATNRSVTLNNICTGNPAYYMASESSSFSGASWLSYSTAPTFSLSSGNGTKTVYFKVKNDAGESTVANDTIMLNEVNAPYVSSFSINNGAATATNRTVTLNNVCTGGPAQYMASENVSFSDASWQSYSAAPLFTLSSGNGTKKVYFKTVNSAGESTVVSDTIYLQESGVPTPDLNVVASGVSVSIGGMVDIGSAAQGESDLSKVFRVENTGTAALTLGKLSVPAGYSVKKPLPLHIDVGAADTFILTLDTATTGTFSGTVSFSTNVLDKNLFSFHVTGTIKNGPPVVSLSINKGNDRATTRGVTLDNSCTRNPVEYKASEFPDFADAVWLPYSAAPNFLLSEGEGAKTVYFKARNAEGESAVAHDSVIYGVSSFNLSVQRISANHAEIWNRKTKSIYSKDSYSFTAKAQLPTTFTLDSLDFSTSISIMVGDVKFEDNLGNATRTNVKDPLKGGSVTFVRKEKDINGHERQVLMVTVAWTSTKQLNVTLIGTPLANEGYECENMVNLNSARDGAVYTRQLAFIRLGDIFGDKAGVICKGRKQSRVVTGTDINLVGWYFLGR